MLPLLFWKYPYRRFGDAAIKTFDLNAYSKLKSDVEFCACGHSIRSGMVHSGHGFAFSCLLASFACVKRMLKKELIILPLVTMQ